jgi:hypothetical protein
MSLTTGEKKKLSRQQWTELPIPDRAIATVDAMAEAEEQPIVGNRGPAFEWSQGVPILDKNVAHIAVHEVDDPEQEKEEVVLKNDYDDEENNKAHEDQDDHAPEEDEEVPTEAADELGQDDDNEQTPAKGGEEDNSDDDTNDNDEDDLPGAESAPRCNLRANQERTYDHRLAQSMDNPESSESYDVQFPQHGASPHQGRGDPETDASGSYDAKHLKQGAHVMPTLREAVEGYMASGSLSEVQSYISGFIMTQMTAKAGIKQHGQVAIDALYKEFLQLHDLGVFDYNTPQH